MKQSTSTYSGFIMIVTLLVIALATIMTTIMFNQGGSYVPYMRALVDRQHAMFSALGGLSLVQELLSRPVEIEQKEEAQPQQVAQQNQQPKPRKPTDEQKMHHLLKVILPVLNTWQHIELEEDDDGVSGMISIYISSQEGKINLNQLFDFEKKQFVGEVSAEQAAEQPQAQKIAVTTPKKDWKQLLTVLFERIEKETKTQNLFKSLEDFLKKRDYPLNDVTELLHIPAFASFKNTIYPHPAHEGITRNKEPQRTYTLTDLFSLHSDAPTIEPWLFSDSMIGVLGLHRAAMPSQDAKKQSDMMNEIIKKAKVRSNWQQNWDTILKPLYGIEAKGLPKQLFDLFNTSFKARYFSAIISATIGESTQRLLVILERIEKSQDTKTVYDVKIRKFSWI